MEKISKIDCDDNIIIESSFSSYCIEKCIFSGVRIGMPITRLNDKLKFSDITFNDCKIVHAEIDTVDIKSLRVNNLSTKKRIRIWSALLENCTISGKIGSIMMIDQVSQRFNDQHLEIDVLNYNKNAYLKMDWALDISNADFTEFDCRCVPAEKIIINNHSQIAVDLKKIKSITKFSDDDMKSMWEIYTKTINRDFTGYNFVLSTSKRTKRHEEELRFFDFIRENGCELKRYE